MGAVPPGPPHGEKEGSVAMGVRDAVPPVPRCGQEPDDLGRSYLWPAPRGEVV